MTHDVVPFAELADGRLITPWFDELPSVAASRQKYDELVWLFGREGQLLTPIEQAVKHRFDRREVVFDEMCGHWLATWRPHVIAEYCYTTYRTDDGGRENIGMHVLMYMQHYGDVPKTWSTKQQKYRRLAIDHLCRLKICCNPLHLEAKTTAANSATGRAARRHLSHAESGQEPLFRSSDELE